MPRIPYRGRGTGSSRSRASAKPCCGKLRFVVSMVTHDGRFAFRRGSNQSNCRISLSRFLNCSSASPGQASSAHLCKCCNSGDLNAVDRCSRLFPSDQRRQGPQPTHSPLANSEDALHMPLPCVVPRDLGRGPARHGRRELELDRQNPLTLVPAWVGRSVKPCAQSLAPGVVCLTGTSVSIPHRTSGSPGILLRAL